MTNPAVWAGLQAPTLLQEIREPWDRPRQMGFGDPVEADPVPLYWWTRETKAHRFVGFCLWYDQDRDHQYDFQGFGYYVPKMGGGLPHYTWMRRHWNVDIYLGRVDPVISTAGKHSFKATRAEAPYEIIRLFRIDESTDLASASFRRRAGHIQRLMGDSVQLPENWEDIRVKTWGRMNRRDLMLEFGHDRTRGLIFWDPGTLLTIKARLGDVKSIWR